MLISYIPFFYLQFHLNQFSASVRLWTSLSPGLTLAYSGHYIAAIEGRGRLIIRYYVKARMTVLSFFLWIYVCVCVCARARVCVWVCVWGGRVCVLIKLLTKNMCVHSHPPPNPPTPYSPSLSLVSIYL